MALAQEKIYTIADIYALPDGERAELIDGQIYYMAPPAGNIRILQGNYSQPSKSLLNRMMVPAGPISPHSLCFSMKMIKTMWNQISA